MPASNVSIEANWTINSHKLTYTVDGVETKDSGEVNYNTLVELVKEKLGDETTQSILDKIKGFFKK